MSLLSVSLSGLGANEGSWWVGWEKGTGHSAVQQLLLVAGSGTGTVLTKFALSQQIKKQTLFFF